jgi:UPF0755 protein
MSEETKPSLLKKVLSIRWNPFRSRVVTFLVVAIVIAFAASAGFVAWYLHTPNTQKESAQLIIAPGSSVKSIAYQMDQKQIIQYPELFSLLVRFFEQGNNMKAGEYMFDAAVTPIEVLRKVVEGETVVHQLTIAEGLMTSQIVKLISDIDILTGDVPEGIKEGALLPETYSYQYGDSRASLIKRMQDAMDKALAEAWESKQEKLPIRNINEVLVLASIIEKETGVAEERRKVSGVFINRLRKGMRLQTDPTVIYSITEGKYVLERALRTKDLSFPSPYNTYQNSGLPPGPIANPGKKSILAAVNPEATSALYFVADGTGGHAFANTLVEHNRNVAKWRRVQRQQRLKNGNIR